MHSVCNNGAPMLYMRSTGRLVVWGKWQSKRKGLLLQQKVIIDLVLDVLCDSDKVEQVCLGL
jgi:hypothetical protein